MRPSDKDINIYLIDIIKKSSNARSYYVSLPLESGDRRGVSLSARAQTGPEVFRNTSKLYTELGYLLTPSVSSDIRGKMTEVSA